MFEDSRIDRDDQPRITDSIEFLVDRAFSSVAKLCMPWRWFRSARNPHEFQSRRRVVSEQARWRIAMVGEFIATKFFLTLEKLEMIVGTILNPKSWFHRNSDDF